MNLFDIPEGDRMPVCIVAIIGMTIVLCGLLKSIGDSAEYADAFKNGYEQVYDPTARKVIWKKASSP